jgi:hypothetical protein
MNKRPSLQDRGVQAAPPPDFDQVWREFNAAFAAFGLSPDKPADAMKLAFWLFVYLRQTQQEPAAPRNSGRQATEGERDAVILAVVEVAKAQGDRRSVAKIIGAFSELNGWPTDANAIRTRRRRYFDAKKAGTPIRRRLVEALQPLLPLLKESARKLEEQERAGLTPSEIEIVTANMERKGRSRS